MTVTVCIPAYRAGGFIAATVGAVLAQTHDDLTVLVAIDPPADGGPDDTAAALAPFAGDPRLEVTRNPRRLGWAENVNALFARVRTPFFCFLPHDDIWSPQYLALLLGALEADPGAVVAYADILRFGASPPVRKGVTLPPGADRLTALMHFLLQGTDAQMWRGVTRSSVRDRVAGFPTDAHKGFAVECEYALALFSAGGIRHVPRTLYFKRIYDRDVVSASRERLLLPLEARAAAWRAHDGRMQAHLDRALADMGAAADDRAVAGAALVAALLQRHQQFVAPALPADLTDRAAAALDRVARTPSPFADEIAAALHLVLAAHFRATGAHTRAAGATEAAWQAAATFATTLAHARALWAANRPLAALERATEALRIGHGDDTRPALALIDEIYDNLGWKTPG